MFIIIYYFVSKFIAIYTESITKLKTELSAKQYEAIRSVKTILALNLKDYILNQLNEIIEKIKISSFKIILLTDAGKSIVNITSTVLFLTAIFYGFHNVINGSMTSGDIYFFIAGFFYLIKPIKSILDISVQIQILLVRTSRFLEIFNRNAIDKSMLHPIELDKIETDIIFENVSFGYDYIRRQNLVYKKYRCI